MRLANGTTDQYLYFVAVDSAGDRVTGLSSFTVYRSRDGAAAAAMTTPTINETDSSNMPGVYELLLDEDTTITAGNSTEEMVFHITATGMQPVTRAIEIFKDNAAATLALVGAGTVTTNSAVDPSTNAITIVRNAAYNDTAHDQLEWTVTKDFTSGWTGVFNVEQRSTETTLITGTVTVTDATTLKVSLDSADTTVTALTTDEDFGAHSYDIPMTHTSSGSKYIIGPYIANIVEDVTGD